MNKLPIPVQAGMIVLIVALAVVWAAVPERGAALAYSAGWYATFAAHLSQREAPAFTALQPLGASASRPLVEFGGAHFLGCDLSMAGAVLAYVTRWDVPPGERSLEARLSFVVAGQVLAVDHWPLRAGDHASAAPAAFLRAEHGRELWLDVTDASGAAVAPASALLPRRDASVRICH